MAWASSERMGGAPAGSDLLAGWQVGMAYNDRPMDNPINWSFRVGRLFDINIRVHIAFVICAVILVAMELPDDAAPRPPLGKILIDALGTYAMLFVIVLLHEFGHCFGARRVGGEAEEILLWPLGGLAYVNPPHNAAAHMVTTLAGPLVNVVLCALCSIALVAWTGSLGAVPWNPLHPTLPVDRSVLFTASTAQFWLIRFYGISYFLLLVNLLPIFPFDGGRILQAWLWPKKGYRSSMEIATGTGMVGAILIGLCGLFLGDRWLLFMIAAFGYITCWQTRRMIREQGAFALSDVGSEFSQGYTFRSNDDEERRPGFFERRRKRKKAQREEKERQRQQQHQEGVERVLRKVSDLGIDSLAPDERRILEEETRRQQML